MTSPSTSTVAADALAVIRRRDEERTNEDPAAYVFPGEKGGRLNANWLSGKFRGAVRDAGLPKAVHFHSLRHTCASWLAMRAALEPTPAASIAKGLS